jgi:hypothetical protein
MKPSHLIPIILAFASPEILLVAIAVAASF